MLGFAQQITGLLGTIAGGLVAALAVPDSVWKRRAILAMAAIGAVQLLLLVLTWEQQHNTGYLVSAAAAGWGFLSWLAGTAALQIILLLAIGGLCGWLLNDVARKQKLYDFLKRDRRVWRSGPDILDLSKPGLLAKQNAAVLKHNAAAAALEAAHRAENEVKAGHGLYVSFTDAPPPEVAAAQKVSAKARSEFEVAQKEYADAERELVEPIYKDLEHQRLLAKGFLPPFSPTSEPVDILAGQWRFLRFSPDFKSATGEGVTYIGVTVTSGRRIRRS